MIDNAFFSYRIYRTRFQPFCNEFTMDIHPHTFLGFRYGLFHNTLRWSQGGIAITDSIHMADLKYQRLTRQIACGQSTANFLPKRGTSLVMQDWTLTQAQTGTFLFKSKEGRLGHVALDAGDSRYVRASQQAVPIRNAAFVRRGFKGLKYIKAADLMRFFTSRFRALIPRPEAPLLTALV
jgi:hypothetical protein